MAYKIRPTAVFVMIAIIIVAIGNRIIRNKRHMAVCIAVGLVGIGSLYLSEEKWEKEHFDAVRWNNYPLTYWLSMGSHGNGDLSTRDEDKEIAISTDNPSEREKLLRENTINNYRMLGIAGTVDLWYRKACTTWSDGYSSAQSRMNSGQYGGLAYELIAGNNNQLMKVYAQAYRFVLFLGMVFFLLSGKKKDGFEQVLLITLLGGVVFYFFWEAKNVYSIPFLPYMIMLATEGICDLGGTSFKGRTVERKKIAVIYGMLVLFVCVNLISIMQCERNNEVRRLCALNTDRVKTPVMNLVQEKESKGELIKQYFNIKDEFNKIEFAVRLVNPDASEYELFIEDNSGGKWILSNISPDMIDEKGKISITFPSINGDGNYCMTLKKLDTDKESIPFLSQSTYLFDLYNGKLIVNDTNELQSDLLMNISYKTDAAWLSRKIVYIFVLFLALIWLIPYKVLFMTGERRQRYSY